MFRTLLAATALLASSILANAADKIVMAVTDIEGLEALQQEFGPFRDKLAELTGLEVELYPVSSRTAAVEAMNSEQVNFVLTGPAEYVVMRELNKAEIVVGWQRPDYFSQIVVRADAGISDIAELKGKKISFAAVGSTSQHLGPAQILADYGLTYGTDYEPQILGRNVAAEALINGDIAAIGMAFTHLQGIREAYPEVPFTVLGRGRDLPNDVLVVSPKVDKAIVDKVKSVFIDQGNDLMASVLASGANDKYAGGFFIANIDDADYDYVRSMYRAVGVETFGAFVGD